MPGLIPIAIALGMLSGAILGYFFAVRIIARFVSVGRPRIVIVCASVVALSVLLPTAVVALAVARNFSDARAQTVLGSLGVAITITVGLAMCFAVLLCVGTAIGAALGVVVSRVMGKQRAS
jgi:hypothetical protein